MNKFKSIICAFGLAGLMLSSCSDTWLNTESMTSSTTGNFYKSIADAERALYGCYAGWQNTTSNMGAFAFFTISEAMSDDCFGGAGTADGFNFQAVNQFDIAQSPSDVNLTNDMWINYYAGVYRCNELISKEDQIDWKNNNVIRGTYMGECRALRAILYFDMVRLWGNIPLITVPTSDNVPQSDPDDVYALIVEDLKYAIENIPADAYPKANAATNEGHVTKYGAQGILARVYLYYTGYYGKDLAGVTKDYVLSGLEEVIASNEYELIPEFKNLWPAASSVSETDSYAWNAALTTFAGRGNKEIVLPQMFNYTQNWDGLNNGNRWLIGMGMRNITFSPYGNGWGQCPVRPDVWNIFEDGDTRQSASIINMEKEGISKLSNFDTYVKDQREYTGYTMKKYTPMCFYDGTTAVDGLGLGNFMISQYQNYDYLRYSDILLMAAELGSSNAKQYLNDVRKRAYTTDGTVSPKFKELEPTKENIMNERRLEFVFEGHRYWDLLRQGVSYAASQISVNEMKVLTGGVDATVTINAQNIIDKQGLMQIPQDQINLSDGVLKQNPGW